MLKVDAVYDFDEGFFQLWSDQDPMSGPLLLTESTGTKRTASVVAENSERCTAVGDHRDYRAEHIDPREICCTRSLCCPEPSCEDVRPTKRRAIACPANPGALCDGDSMTLDYDASCRECMPCDSGECSPADVCYDPHCDQVQECPVPECADKCSDPECSKGICPDQPCFCSRCEAPPCTVGDLENGCHFAHSAPGPDGTIYCFNDAPCHFNGEEFAHPRLPAFDGYQCNSTHHLLPERSNGMPPPSQMTPLSTNGSLGSLGSTLHAQYSSFSDPSSFASSAALDGFSLWALSKEQNMKMSQPNGCVPMGRTSPTAYTPMSAFSDWDVFSNAASTPLLDPCHTISGDPMQIGWTQTPCQSPFVDAIQPNHGLDFLASVAKVSLVEEEPNPNNSSGTSPLPSASTSTPPLRLKTEDSQFTFDTDHSPTDPSTTTPSSHTCEWETAPGILCLQTFPTPKALHQHLKTAHVDPSPDCICRWSRCSNGSTPPKDFKQRSKLTRHLLVHDGYRPHACKFCDKSFATNQARQNHERTHTGDRPYVCPDCGFRTTTQTQWVTHVEAMHSGRKRYRCRYEGCGFVCADSSNLSKHERIHQGLRPYRCPHPGCVFRPDCRWENLKRHLRKTGHCPELLDEKSEALERYKEQVKREESEWLAKNPVGRSARSVSLGPRKRSRSARVEGKEEVDGEEV
ncbi:uncharacterized protein EI97DRAFT_430672 [Westerdykella ornata]|uniref:C2H2 type master regulator of conidiophore development brlA n=1 Tax=Westerdykella ornata TaxID=318751 RepID=A0A6A6JTE8_WESOR|nr:uncharacterized protein EI97DRAFT_430672 [Westerdykella ornata]KAF2279637.1 hypothetical protein EI97DRAFT_430672 [Westerdykella ornata]